MKNNPAFIKEFLEEKVLLYNQPGFIASDPIQIPHLFTRKEDIEIASFLTAILAWGQRKTIINKARQLLRLMDNCPYDFIRNSGKTDWKDLKFFCHRTFNGTDTLYFIQSLKNIFFRYGSLQALFETEYLISLDIKETLRHFRCIFFEMPCQQRTLKHISDVNRGASAKRLNMFLRWMVRKDKGGVDFGLWENIPPAALYIPLDIHTSTVARKLGLLKRRTNDWQAVEELTGILRTFDPVDPVKYDFALFGLGANNDLLIC